MAMAFVGMLIYSCSNIDLRTIDQSLIVPALEKYDGDLGKAEQQLIDDENNRMENLMRNASKELAEENARNERAAKKRKCLEVVPLENQDFKASRVLEPCRGIKAFQEWAAQVKVRADLIQMLQLELKCQKWYPESSVPYFRALGVDFAATAKTASSTLSEKFGFKLKELVTQVLEKPARAGTAGALPQIFLEHMPSRAATGNADLQDVSSHEPARPQKYDLVEIDQ